MKMNTIILAAGMGKRLKTETCKVIVPLMSKPLIIHLLDNLRSALSPKDTYIVIGYQGESVQKVVTDHYPEVHFAWQKEQLGTGHAVMQTRSAIMDTTLPTLILAGDVPLINEAMITSFFEFHQSQKAAISVLTTSLPDPTGYGRIVRSKTNALEQIVEHKDATDAQKKINEINSGIYLVETSLLFELLDQVTPNNNQNEYYLTDIIKIGGKKGLNIQAYLFPEADLLRGVNSREDLATLARYIYQASIKKHLENGVTILSPETTFIEPDVVIEKDVIIEPCVTITGRSHIKEGSIVHSFSRLANYISKPKEDISSR